MVANSRFQVFSLPFYRVFNFARYSMSIWFYRSLNVTINSNSIFTALRQWAIGCFTHWIFTIPSWQSFSHILLLERIKIMETRIFFDRDLKWKKMMQQTCTNVQMNQSCWKMNQSKILHRHGENVVRCWNHYLLFCQVLDTVLLFIFKCLQNAWIKIFLSHKKKV